MMNPRIASIENLIASDPGERNIFGLLVADQLRLAAKSLRLARRVGIVSGFYILEAGAGETDGPPGAKLLGETLEKLGIEVDYITDELNAPLFRALDIEPTVDCADYLDSGQPTHLVSIERVGRGVDGRYRNMHGVDVTEVTAPLDELFIQGSKRGLTTIGIGDGGNEIGMGNIFAGAQPVDFNPAGGPGEVTPAARCVVPTDFCVAAGVSNWGAYGLAGALSVLEGRDLLPPAECVAHDLERIVREGGAVDGVTHRHEVTTDGLHLSASVRMLENIRRQLAPSPLARDEPLTVGILGYGETGRAAAPLLARHGHRVRISDCGPVTVEPGSANAGVESGGHSIEFLGECDLVVASPGVRADSPIHGALHRSGIPVFSELELAFQLGSKAEALSPLIGVTGTIGKRSTVELMQSLFQEAGRSLTIGGNRGLPLSALLIEENPADCIALAISSFMLESVVHFRPDVAVLLNIDREHLDRHRSIAEYVRIKSRIFMNQRPSDALILPYDDERLRALARKHRGRTFFISSRQAVDRGAWVTAGHMHLNVDGVVETVGPVDAPFPENLAAAVLSARLCGISTERIARAIQKQRMRGETV